MSNTGNGMGSDQPILAPQEAKQLICQSLLDRIEEQCTQLVVSRTKPVQTVHRLRIDIRRALAALRIFEDLFPESELRWFRRLLKRIRKRSGAVRDLDVLTRRLMDIKSHRREDKQAQESLRKAVDWLRNQRPKELKSLRRQIGKSLKAKNFPRRKTRLLQGDAGSEKGLADSRLKGGSAGSSQNQQQFPAICDEFLQATAFRMDDLNSIHQFRLQSKNLRYSIEILSSHLASGVMEELLPIVTQLQQSLGKINDCRFARIHLKKLAQKFAGSDAKYLRRLAKEAKHDLRASLSSFEALWTPDFVQRLHQLVDALCSSNQQRQHSGSETEDQEESAEIGHGRQDWS